MRHSAEYVCAVCVTRPSPRRASEGAGRPSGHRGLRCSLRIIRGARIIRSRSAMAGS